MRRVVVLGRGASGKSTLAARLGKLTGLPVIELDLHFWPPDLNPTPPGDWARMQRELAGGRDWIMDGDLGPYDVVEIRLRTADTVIVLDFSLARCAWRALRRSRERIDFWRWLITYRRRSLPSLRSAIRTHAPGAAVRVFRHPRAVERFLLTLGGDPEGVVGGVGDGGGGAGGARAGRGEAAGGVEALDEGDGGEQAGAAGGGGLQQ
jgi:hypothetical protein